jgi:hypothetical protein
MTRSQDFDDYGNLRSWQPRPPAGAQEVPAGQEAHPVASVGIEPPQAAQQAEAQDGPSLSMSMFASREDYERAKFEAFGASLSLDLRRHPSRDQYLDGETRLIWEGWIARAATQSPAPADRVALAEDAKRLLRQALYETQQGGFCPSPVPQGWKLLKDSTFDERSWPEDSGHENGNYFCNCIHCGRQFTGHKRRCVCRVCASPYALNNPPEESK